MMRDVIDIGQIVIQLHDIARKLEHNKKHWVFGNDLRKLADRLAEVHKNHCRPVLTDEEKIAYDYARAISGMPLEEIEDV